jgi:hypothetical protein
LVFGTAIDYKELIEELRSDGKDIGWCCVQSCAKPTSKDFGVESFLGIESAEFAGKKVNTTNTTIAPAHQSLPLPIAPI